MRRENKLALIVGFSVLLVVAVLVSDHLSKARQDEVADGLDTLAPIPDARAFIDTPLSERGRVGAAPEPEAIAVRPDEHPDDRPIERADLAARTGPDLATQRAFPESADERLRGPVVIENGSLSADEPDRVASVEDDAAGPMGLPKKLIEKYLTNRTVLAQPTGGGTDITSERPAAGGKVPGVDKYTIREGDTLFEICEAHLGDGTRWREVAAMNPGKIGENGKVFVNVTIDLPRGTGWRPADTVPAEVASSPAETRSYTVKKGDTLSEIVMREVGSVRHLDRVRALNPWLKDQKDTIRIGQTLTLPVLRQARAR